MTGTRERLLRARLKNAGPGRAPDWVGVGVQRAGTTRWFDLITAHPDAGGPLDGRKEQHFFDLFGATTWTSDRAAEYYRAFPAEDERSLGEWTPRYVLDPWTPPLLAAAAPKARLLLLLRDPIARLRSGLVHSRRRSRSREEDRLLDAFVRGIYVPQIQRLLNYVDRSRLLVLQYELCVKDPYGQLARTYEHLGLTPWRPTENLIARSVFALNAPPPAISPAFLEAATAAYRSDLADLTRLVPGLDLDLWPLAPGK